MTPRTVRFYISQGLLPPPAQLGPGARYGEGHLRRLRLIRQLQRQHLPLAEIRARLAALGDDEVAALLDRSRDEPPPASALDYVRGLLGAPGAPARTAQPFAPPAPAARAAPPPAAMAAASPSLPPTGPSAESGAVPPPARGAVDAWRAIRIPSLRERGRDATGAEGRQPPLGRSQWDRIALTTDIELHVRRPLTRADNRLVERLLAFARQLLEEEAR